VCVEWDIPDGGFLFGSEPSCVFSRSASVSAVDYVLVFGVVTVPRDDWEVLVPYHQGSVVDSVSSQPGDDVNGGVGAAGDVCCAVGG